MIYRRPRKDSGSTPVARFHGVAFLLKVNGTEDIICLVPHCARALDGDVCTIELGLKTGGGDGLPDRIAISTAVADARRQRVPIGPRRLLIIQVIDYGVEVVHLLDII